jgi:hypothetical protein
VGSLSHSGISKFIFVLQQRLPRPQIRPLRPPPDLLLAALLCLRLLPLPPRLLRRRPPRSGRGQAAKVEGNMGPHHSQTIDIFQDQIRPYNVYTLSL